MEIMATHNLSHESLNSSHESAPLQLAGNREPLQLGLERTERRQLETGRDERRQLETGRDERRQLERVDSSNRNHSIGCQTAVSWPRQDTLVPLTSLLQLVNNSIMTVMENIEKVLLVNSSEEGVLTTDSINSLNWNSASNASSPRNNAGTHELTSPMRVERQVDQPQEHAINVEKLEMRPIVIQDRFSNSLEIPTSTQPCCPAPAREQEGGQPPEKRFCPAPRERQQENVVMGNRSPNGFISTSENEERPPSTPGSSGQESVDTSLSPTVNVAGSLTKYICPYCYKVFNWKTNMNRHISVTHLMKPKPTIKVPIMRKSKPYTCPICGNTFAWRSNMNRHILHLHKIDHKQLNKLLLSAYLPDMRNSENNNNNNNMNNNPVLTTASAHTAHSNNTIVSTSSVESYSSLGSLTMLPQNSFKTVTPPPRMTSAPATSSPNNHDHISMLYRNHKALLDTVKKEQQVPMHVKEAALSSFYSNKSLFESPPTSIPTTGGAFTTPVASTAPAGLLTPPDKFSPPNCPPNAAALPTSTALSALYQRALIEQRSAAPDVTSMYQNHRAMLDTVSLLSNLGSMNVNNTSNGEVEIKLEGENK